MLATSQGRCDRTQLDREHSVRSLKLLAAGARLGIRELVYDSTGFQLWGSECYRQGYALTSGDRPSSQDLYQTALRAAGGRTATDLNDTMQGDQITVYLRHES